MLVLIYDLLQCSKLEDFESQLEATYLKHALINLMNLSTICIPLPIFLTTIIIFGGPRGPISVFQHPLLHALQGHFHPSSMRSSPNLVIAYQTLHTRPQNYKRQVYHIVTGCLIPYSLENKPRSKISPTQKPNLFDRKVFK